MPSGRRCDLDGFVYIPDAHNKPDISLAYLLRDDGAADDQLVAQEIIFIAVDPDVDLAARIFTEVKGGLRGEHLRNALRGQGEPEMFRLLLVYGLGAYVFLRSGHGTCTGAPRSLNNLL